jgi:NADPH:quinone reductase-like Zn-dependent oxidoreductase
LDYNSVRFEDKVKNVDVVFDTVGGETLERSWGVVRGGGTLVTIVGDTPEDMMKKYGIYGVSFVVEPNRGQLVRIAQLIDEGTVRPVVEAVYPLSRAREAYERGLRGHNRGKLVLKVID